MISPWGGMAIVLAALGALFGVLGWYQRRFSPAPELPRKFMHIGMGVVTLSFPWLFESAWPVITLALLAVAALLGVRLLPTLRNGVGDVLHAVERESLGEVYFPLSVAIVFWLAKGEAILFTVPILILTFADALAALIGVRYGQWLYTTAEGYKSAEGSLAFFIVAFLSAFIPLVGFSDVGSVEAALIAVVLGLLVMILEAIAWRGLDNLFIPLGGFVFLKVYAEMSVADLLPRLLVLLALIGFVIYWRRRTTLNDSAALAAALAGYVFWALGGWQWLVAPLLLLIAYPALSPRNDVNRERIHDTRSVISVVSGGLVWVFLAKSLDRPEWLYLATAVFASHLAVVALARLLHQYPDWPHFAVLLTCIINAWMVIFGSWLLLDVFGTPNWVFAFMGLASTALAVITFYRWQPRVTDCPNDAPRWWRQGLVAFGASALTGVASGSFI